MSIKTSHEATRLDTLHPAANPARDAVNFRRILAARAQIAEAEPELREVVGAARQAGDSRTVVAAADDTTRQAAQQRFGKDYYHASRRINRRTRGMTVSTPSTARGVPGAQPPVWVPRSVRSGELPEA